MWDKMLTYILENHRGKAVGLLLGLLAGILVINYGFWKTIFIIFCIILGFIVGKAIDDNSGFEDWINRFRGR
jgi:uncharacterized membrane protein